MPGDMSGAREVERFEEERGGAAAALVDAESADGAADAVGATSPAIRKAKRVSAKILDRNMRATEAQNKAGVTFQKGEFFNLEPASEYEKKTLFDIVFGESNMTGKEFETVLDQIRGSDPGALLINIIESKQLFSMENIGTVNEHVLVHFSWLLARGKPQNSGPGETPSYGKFYYGKQGFFKKSSTGESVEGYDRGARRLPRTWWASHVEDSINIWCSTMCQPARSHPF